MTMWEKQILTKAISIQKENWGATTHFPEIMELTFGKKMPFIVLYFQGYPHFSLSIPITLANEDLRFPCSHNLCKNISVLGGTVLK